MRRFSLFMLALGLAFQVSAQAPFNCTSGSILTISNDTLYSYIISGKKLTSNGAAVYIDTTGWNIPSVPLAAAAINAIAYDTISNTVWGVISNGSNYVGLVQIGSDGKTKLLPIANPNFTVETTLGTTPPNISSFTAIRWTVGEIHNGYLYLSAGGSNYSVYPNASPFVIIDINPSRSTYLNVLLPLNLGTPIASGTEAQFNINSSYGALGDWVYMPANGSTLIQDALVYISTNTSNVSTLTAIAVINGSASVMATSPQIVLPNGVIETSFGSLFTDGKGNLYAKGSTTGNLYQINMPTSTTATSVQATLIGNIGTTTMNIKGSGLLNDNNDGTGCLVSSKSLPIALQSFTVKEEGDDASVQWTTTMETNNKGFYVERSTDGQNWQDITFVASKAANGNSSELLNYQYIDEYPQQGYNYYRLKQVDLDGTVTFTDVQSIVFSNTKTRIYPNPANGVLHVQVSASGTYRLINTGGAIVLQGSLQSGDNLLNVTDLASGIYFMQIVSGNNVKNTYKIEIR